jgi:hypothetical protein
VEVDQIEDLAVLRRYPGQGVVQQFWSAGSAILDAIFSSNSTSVRRRRAESAL